MVNLQVSPQFEGLFDPNKLIQAAEAAVRTGRFDSPVELSLVIDTDEALRELNRQYLGADAPTDVLSFPADEFDPDEQYPYIGDIIISLPRARIQAEAAGHPLVNEMQLLVVHGVLHLLGHDHQDAGQKEEMWKAQAEILESIGCRINQLPEN
jgi:probable rRNA maturation factor